MPMTTTKTLKRQPKSDRAKPSSDAQSAAETAPNGGTVDGAVIGKFRQPMPEPKEPAKEAAKPAGAKTITIKGAKGGSVPTYVDGAMRRIPCGKPVEVSKAEKAYLDANGFTYE